MNGGVTDNKYLIVAGVPKAGTTSLFNYLSNHPSICGASIKETCFFLDVDYPRRSKYRFPDGMESYYSLFEQCNEDSLRLEATPLYLYSDETAARIRSMLSNVKIIIILREPIDRLYSFYRMARAVFTRDYTFEEYVRVQLELFREGLISDNRYFRALVEGKYSSYLGAYIETFGTENVIVVQFGMLKIQPRELMGIISDYAGIDPTFFDNYSFRVYHKTPNVRSKTVHSGFLKLKKIMRWSFSKKKRTRAIFKFARSIVEPYYFTLINREETSDKISEETLRELQQFYMDEPSSIAQILGVSKFEWIS